MLIGIVGKSCCGKNYISQIIQDMGFEVWDLDLLSHEALDANIAKIEETFGKDVICFEKGTFHVSRKALSKIVFQKAFMRKELENIVYPWITEKIISHEKNFPKKVLFVNGALLRRSKIDSLCKAVIYVNAPYEVRLKRALLRDAIEDAVFESRESSQNDVDFRENEYRCPVLVVENDSNVKNLELNRQIKDICDRIGITDIEGNKNREEE